MGDLADAARRSQRALGAFVLMLLAVAGCRQAPTAPTSRVDVKSGQSASSWLAPAPGSSQIVAAVRAYWRTYLRVTGGSLDAAAVQTTVEQVAAGGAAQALVDVAGSDAVAGMTVRGELFSRPRVVDQSARFASVLDCVDDRTGAYRADGSRLDVDDPRSHRVAISLARVSGQWRVTDVQVQEATCALG